MNHAAPPDQAVYSEPKGEVWAMLRQRDCVPLTWPQKVYMCTPSPADLADDGPDVTVAVRRVAAASRYPLASGASAFVGRRRSAHGTDRLVIADVRPTHRPASARARSLDVFAAAFTAAGPAPDQSPVGGKISFLSVPVASHAYVRVLAGQRDLSDPSRFTIRYEVHGDPGTVAGRLNDDGTVLLEITP